MIEISKSPTADTRTCEFAKVTKDTLSESSRQHIMDVVSALFFFASHLHKAAAEHDSDKLSQLDWFHHDFVTGFKETGWWDNHRKITRHHLANEDGVPDDVNLIDVLEYISDGVMAGISRSGSVNDLKMDDALLRKAFVNTIELLKNEVVIKDSTP